MATLNFSRGVNEDEENHTETTKKKIGKRTKKIMIKEL